jgi:hypothetical protein
MVQGARKIPDVLEIITTTNIVLAALTILLLFSLHPV